MYFVISLDSTILVSSFTTSGPTHTSTRVSPKQTSHGSLIPLTLFTNETVIPVVGVVRVTQTSMRVFELEELVSVLS